MENWAYAWIAVADMKKKKRAVPRNNGVQPTTFSEGGHSSPRMRLSPTMVMEYHQQIIENAVLQELVVYVLVYFD